jgi:hypothetical protein
MKKKMAFVFVTLIFLTVNITQGIKSQKGNIRLNQLFSVAAADSEGEDDEETAVTVDCTYIDVNGVSRPGTAVICFVGTNDCTPTQCTN